LVASGFLTSVENTLGVGPEATIENVGCFGWIVRAETSAFLGPKAAMSSSGSKNNAARETGRPCEASPDKERQRAHWFSYDAAAGAFDCEEV
jgi:hypothetical protein